MIAFLLVWLRAAGLVGQALALGAVVFALVVLRRGREPASAPAVARTLVLAAAGAALAAVSQTAVLVTMAAGLADEAGWPIGALLGSTVGIAALIRVGLACLAVVGALALRRAPDSGGRSVLLLVTTLLLALTGALASHATGRVDGRVWLWSLTGLHHVAAGAWLGGVMCAAVLGVCSPTHHPERWLHRFSTLAAAAVAGLALTGMTLALVYVGTAEAAIGTSYGAMVLTKLVIFAALLTMGALNHHAVHGRLRLPPWRAQPPASIAPALVLRRRLEVEAGLALVAIALAASLGSAPPASDVTTDRATPEEVRRIFTPQWPRLQTPSAAELAAASDLADPKAPRQPVNTQWSEFGHHVAGVFVLAMGLLATLERTGRAPWARHWPLLLIPLTGFITWSMDPEGWQTGTVGFWEQLLDPEVLQHRLLLVVTGAFAVAEWRVRSGRHPRSPWRFVFPLACICGGVLLLAHVHQVNNPKTGFFMELTHLPLGLTALLAGWARWLELRLAPAHTSWSGRLWAPALVVFGLLLVFYREA
ncbi:MAG TPA: CopD family protein [Methylomirabilota bacterium]|nr:CopD family protein [Methylomirabilota bacterium]